MSDPIQIIFSALTLLGLGGIVGGYITYLNDALRFGRRYFVVKEDWFKHW